MTYRQRLYREFLQSDEWRRKRREIWLRCGGHCENCGNRIADGHCHHLRYDTSGDPDYWDHDWPKGWLPENYWLKWLCLKCHAEAHDAPTLSLKELDRLVMEFITPTLPHQQLE